MDDERLVRRPQHAWGDWLRRHHHRGPPVARCRMTKSRRYLKKIGQEPPKVKVSFTKGERSRSSTVRSRTSSALSTTSTLKGAKSVYWCHSSAAKHLSKLDFLQVQRIV